MSEATQLARTEPSAIRRMSPMEMIQKALDTALASGDNGLSVANLILEQMRVQRDYEDKAAFQAALRRIQDKLKKIPKRGWNPDTKSWYPRATDVDEALNELLKEEQMTLSFEPRPSEKLEEVLIVGTLSLGAYSKEYVLPMPADGKGAKGGGVMSRTHATGSAITYGKRYLKDMIFNLSFLEHDDDGNRAGGGSRLDDGVAADWLAKIQECATIQQLNDAWKEASAAAKKVGDTNRLTEFTEAAGKRKNAIIKGANAR